MGGNETEQRKSGLRRLRKCRDGVDGAQEDLGPAKQEKGKRERA